MNVLDRLFALEHHGIKLGLQNISTILRALGDPHEQWASIHVAGTNGKGSVTAMIERALRAAGHRTGRYTSPHLSRIEERIALDGDPIAARQFIDLAEHVLGSCDALQASGELAATPTFFEVTTAIAFEAFRRARITVGVIEVGLGGRFDATNVITPRVCAITSIALDHQRYLGSTLADIAFEKAGIIKPHVPVVIGDLPRDARTVIDAVSIERQAPLIVAGRDRLRSISQRDGRATMSFDTRDTAYRDVELGLAGDHQVGNALVAACTLETAADRGLAVTYDDVVTGLSEAEWPARLEWIDAAGGSVLLDAAHNPAGAGALASYLRQANVGRLPLVIAIMRDKDIDGIIRPLAPHVSTFVATETGSDRSTPAAELRDQIVRIVPGADVEAHPHWRDAVAAAWTRHHTIVAAGSIFLVGPLRVALLGAARREAP